MFATSTGGWTLLSASDKYIRTGSYNLLSNQVRYGGIGIYSTFLEECHLASMHSLTLCPLGEELAEEFPGPPPERWSTTRMPGYRWTL